MGFSFSFSRYTIQAIHHIPRHNREKMTVRKYPHKALAFISVATIGALCFGSVPANASPQVLATVQGAESNQVTTLEHREQITEIFNLLNAYRQEKGLEPLLFSVPASEESQAWSKTIAGYQRLEHNPNAGQDPRIKAAWWGVWLENVAARWDDDGASMFQQWVNSPSHNSNLLNPNVNTVGIGLFITGNKDFVKYPNNYYMWGTQNFYSFKDGLPAQTYKTPDDYFEGRPALENTQLKTIVVKKVTTDYTKGTYTLPAVEGVEYYVNGVKKPAGTYSSNWEKVVIEYRPLSGWKHSTADNKYSTTIDFTQYLQQTEVPVPRFNDDTGEYTIDGNEFVDYYVNGIQKPMGSYDSGWTTITITVKPHPGYVIKGMTSWTHTFVKPSVVVTPKAPTFTASTGKYVIPTTTGIQYKVNGVNVNAGTYDSGWKPVTITAVANSGYKISGTASWPYTFTKPVVSVIPKAPTFNNTTGKYIIPATTGVQYKVNGTAVKSGTYDSGWKKITVTVTATTGYKISGTTSWSYAFVKPVVIVKPNAPTFNKTTGKYTIPATAGVQYKVNGVTTKAGTYNSGWKKITVTAVANAGYQLSGTASWSYTFTKPAVVVKPKAPTFNKSTGKYVIPTTTGVQYKVNGSAVKAGTYNSGWKKITVTAVAKTGYKLSGTSSWAYTFIKPKK
ncbi:MAG: CAP domain-containing protein [Enterococcus sp.]|nr:CAP domain-containing protein [Enterococcus sp.]